jgi:Smg protein
MRPARNTSLIHVAITAGVLGYIGVMFEVLVFVYEHYWRGDACPELEQLGRKLSAHGFEPDEIHDALVWLDGLNLAAQSTRGALTTPDHTASPSAAQSAARMRVYSVAEQDHLGAECLGFVSFLESSGVLPAPMREIVLDRAMAAPGDPVSLDDLKIIVLMVYWSFGEEPDALVLDELCDPADGRLAH